MLQRSNEAPVHARRLHAVPGVCVQQRVMEEAMAQAQAMEGGGKVPATSEWAQEYITRFRLEERL